MSKGARKTKKKGGVNTRKTMLNMGRIDSFEWNLKNILEGMENSENRGAVFGSIRNKAINLGIEESGDYVLEIEQDGVIAEEMSKDILDLLDRFSRRR